MVRAALRVSAGCIQSMHGIALEIADHAFWDADGIHNVKKTAYGVCLAYGRRRGVVFKRLARRILKKVDAQCA